MKNQIILGDVREVVQKLADQSVNCIITSPPYFGLRDYQTATWKGGDGECDHKPGSLSRANGSTLTGGHNHGGHLLEGYKTTCAKCGAIRIDKQLGLEETPEAYVANLVSVFRELWRVLRDDGTLWLVIGDSYAGSGNRTGEGETRNLSTEKFHGGQYLLQQRRTVGNHNLKQKNLIGIPWRVAFALQADGWYLRNDIIWHKPSAMPESVTDRCTKAHEYIFLLTKKAKYWFDQDSIREPHKEESIKRDQAGYKTAFVGRHTMPGENRPYSDSHNGFNHPSGRNKRTVWTIAEEHDPLLSYLLDKLAADDLDKLQEYLDQYTDDANNKDDMWIVPAKPYKGAHFAAFPAKLIEPCIRAGCPSRICMECGEPWMRVVEKIGQSLPVSERHGRTGHNGQPPQISGNYWEGPTTKSTNIFVSTCQCCPLPANKESTIPGIVLDPFFGSGTVAEVAIKNKRNWVGIELNPEYIELARERIRRTQPPLFAIENSQGSPAKNEFYILARERDALKLRLDTVDSKMKEMDEIMKGPT